MAKKKNEIPWDEILEVLIIILSVAVNKWMKKPA